MRKIFIILLILLPLKFFACANAHIFKIFPIGISGDTIITIDIDIYRGMNGTMLSLETSKVLEGAMNTEKTTNIEEYSNTRKSSFTVDVTSPSEIEWEIKSYITKYDKHQQPLEIIPVDSIYFGKYEYTDELHQIYKRAFDKVVSEEKQIKLFQPKKISFCSNEYKCKGLQVKDRTVLYKNIEYPIEILKDSTYYGIGIDYFDSETSKIPPVNSVREYECDGTELIVFHAQLGGAYGKYDAPKVKFDKLETAVYEEPILYHGNGYDLFFITRKKK